MDSMKGTTNKIPVKLELLRSNILQDKPYSTEYLRSLIEYYETSLKENRIKVRNLESRIDSLRASQTKDGIVHDEYDEFYRF